MTKSRRNILKGSLFFLLGSLALFLALESAARWAGFARLPLFEYSSDYGYRFKPDQKADIVGRRISFNAQGLRSPDIEKEPRAGQFRILCLGDSITYGGLKADQRETYPCLLESLLNQSGTGMYEVINASAPGWAIENEEAYLERFGAYKSQMVILQLNSDDLFQRKSISPTGPCFGDLRIQPPRLALEGLLCYLADYFGIELKHDVTTAPIKEPEKSGNVLEENLKGFEEIVTLIRSFDAVPVVFLVERAEGFEPRTQSHQDAKTRIRDLAQRLDVTFINIGPKMTERGGGRLFCDSIHPNPRGNRVIAEILFPIVLDKIRRLRG